MTHDEVERMKVLCQKIELEEDQHKFSQLIAELIELLERQTKRLEHPHSPIERK